MSVYGPSIAQASSCYYWSLGDGATRTRENKSVALKHVDASLQESCIVLKGHKKRAFPKNKVNPSHEFYFTAIPF